MIESTLKPLTRTLAVFISLAQQCRSHNQLKQVHAGVFKLRCRSTFLYNTIIRGYVIFNLPSYAILFYKDMLRQGVIKNNYTLTPLVKACSCLALPEFGYMGLSVQAHVIKLGFCNDPFIVSALIEFHTSNLDMGQAQKLFDEIPVRDVVLWTSMVDGYGKTGNIEKAVELFVKMPERNVVSWSAIMAAYSRAGDFKEVLRLYRTMQDSELLNPNESILVSALKACAHLGALAEGMNIHSYAKKYKFDSNPVLATALVDMYAKCGCLKLALNIFEEIGDKDSAAWNSIISGVAMSGDALKSIELFDNMIISGINPTEATFVSVLSACTHANLVEKGLALFHSMGQVYKVEPKKEHYACVVDLLARSGRLEEAEKFVDENINQINNGDANIWGALLGACRTYGNIVIGNRVWNKIVAAGIFDSGIYMLAHNMYEEAGWDNESKIVRRFIENKQMKKTPAVSAVEVDGVVQEFFAGDKSHPLS